MSARIADEGMGAPPVYKIRVTVECLLDDVVRVKHTDHVVFTDPIPAVLRSAWGIAHDIVDVAREKSEVSHG